MIGVTMRQHRATVDLAWERGAHHERERIRKALAPAVRELKRQAAQTTCVCKLIGYVAKKPPCDTCRTQAALKTIGKATRIPKPAKGGRRG